MRKLTVRLVVAAVLLFAVAVFPGVSRAQAAHQAVLTWVAPTDAVAGSTYNVYRASGGCPATGVGTLTFAKVNAGGVTALTYTDSGLAVGVYCYYVTQVQNASESIPGNTAGGPVKPNTVTIQIVIS